MSSQTEVPETKIERTEEELQKLRTLHSELVDHALRMQAERRAITEEDQVVARRHRNEDKQFFELARELREARAERIERHARALKNATHSELIDAALKLQARRAELADTMKVVKEHAVDPKFRLLAQEIKNFEKIKNDALKQQRAPVLAQLHAELATRSIADLRHVVETEAEAVSALEAEVAAANATATATASE